MKTERPDVTGIDVAYVARLARLDLTEEERARFQAQLGDIVGYVRQISRLDVSGIEPTSHAMTVHNVFRDDAVKPGLDPEVVRKNAPAILNGQFKVPRIVE
jgi:aspartyl-tRNA(Asn)/glutamyl-tRNA(Gln) amidotransferase subunit C